MTIWDIQYKQWIKLQEQIEADELEYSKEWN